MKPVFSVILIDASTSMERNFQNAPQQALEAFVRSQANSPDADDTFVGIFSFASDLKMLTAKPLVPVKEITDIPYISDGVTRLYGSVLEVLNLLENLTRHETEARVLLHVFTDGADNMSHEKLPALRQAADAARAKGWTLKIVGFGIQGDALAREMNFSATEAITVPADAQSIIRTARHASYVTTMTSRGITPMSYDEYARNDH